MALTTNFSEEFYDKLGHEVVDEMVNWFNQTDREYRTQLRDLNDRNFERFEAKIERFEAKVDQRFAEQDARLDVRFGALERRFGEQDVKWEARLSQQDVKWERRLNEQFSHLLKWMFVFWTTTLVSVIGMSLAIVRFLR